MRKIAYNNNVFEKWYVIQRYVKKDVWMVYDKEAEDAEAGKEAGGTDQKKNSLSK